MNDIRVRLATDADTEPIVGLWLEMMEVHAALVPEYWTLGPDPLPKYREWLATMMQDPAPANLCSGARGPDRGLPGG